MNKKRLTILILSVLFISILYAFWYYREDLFFKKDEMIYGEIRFSLDVTESDKKYHLAKIRYYSDLIEANPDIAENYLVRAESWYRINQQEKALHDVNTAIKIEPTLFRAYFIKSRILVILNEKWKAIQEMERVMIFSNDDELFLKAQEHLNAIQAVRNAEVKEKYKHLIN